MPELPEVETVRRSLRPYVEGRSIVDVRAPWHRSLSGLSGATLRRRVAGQTIVRLERRAKFLILRLEAGRLLVHLRMTGKLYPLPEPPKDKRHVSAYLTLSDGSILVFHDVRRFGRIVLLENEEEYDRFSRGLGPEPLGRSFTPDRLLHDLRAHRRQLKPLLLDQSFVAGLGNIYVDEALWEARLHPLCASDRVSRARATALHAAIRRVLRESIRANGTTFMDFKFLGGQRGGYTDQLRVFGRTGEPCRRCGSAIQKLRIAQRGTHICTRCQKVPAAR